MVTREFQKQKLEQKESEDFTPSSQLTNGFVNLSSEGEDEPSHLTLEGRKLGVESRT